MLFNSAEFLFFFLPITLIGFLFLLKQQKSNLLVAWLVLASLFFYGWWNPAYLILIVFSMVFNFNFGKLLAAKKHAKLLLGIGVSVNLGFLGYFKYTNFLVDQINTVASTNFNIETIILPLAISFFTFQQIAYLVDAKRGLTSEYSFLHYALFVTFFPQLIAGPIVHHKQMLPQFEAVQNVKFDYMNIAIGLSIFAIGLFKKTVLADGIAPYANVVFAQAEAGESISMFVAWGGALAYTFQLYFDFSGYSDMAIGIARLFGIVLPLNFYSPYKALNISEFWRRWHITLSSFLRDYIYIPLGGNRLGEFNRYRNLLITMLLGGLWHGAGWNFLIWGALHGSYLSIQQVWSQYCPTVSIIPSTIKKILAWSVTFIAVVYAWVLFRATSLDGAVTLMSAMSGLQEISLPNAIYVRLDALHPIFDALSITSFLGGGSSFVFNWIWILFGFAIVLVLPNLQDLFNAVRFSTEKFAYRTNNAVSFVSLINNINWQPKRRWALIAAVCFSLGILTLSQVSEFLYFQF
ncbi:MAG: alginate O-acetyltransferase complex protein AlgI [Glaciecola sp.]|jgi:alginate O-acetyltransferase complex protein AlgI